MIKGFIFDFDGLILDTETPHLQAWQEVFAEYGEHIQLADWLKLIGTGPVDYDPGIDLFNRRQGNLDLQAVRKQANTLTTQKMANMKDRERIVKVSWGEPKSTFPVEIQIKAYDRQGLMGDISNLLNDENINLKDIKLTVTHNLAYMTLVVEVSDIAQLSRVLTKIENLPNVMEAHRLKPG